MSDLTVVIPTLARRNKTLARVLELLERQTIPPARFSVNLVVDGSAPDLPLETIGSSRAYELTILRSDRPGASAARNRGWRKASAPLVLFLDDDILPSPTLVEEHLKWHRTYPAPTVAVLGDVRWASELRLTPFMRWLDDGIQFDYPNIVGIEAGWGRFYTANVSVKRELLARVDGFDERRLPFGYEDLDIGYRMQKSGLVLLYNRAATAQHLQKPQLDEWRERVRRIAVAERTFVNLHPDIAPYFYKLFSTAASAPRARGRGRFLLGLVPKSTPWLGRRIWYSADMYYRQALAPSFLEAWNTQSYAPEATSGPESSGGSFPGGPK